MMLAACLSSHFTVVRGMISSAVLEFGLVLTQFAQLLITHQSPTPVCLSVSVPQRSSFPECHLDSALPESKGTSE